MPRKKRQRLSSSRSPSKRRKVTCDDDSVLNAEHDDQSQPNILPDLSTHPPAQKQPTRNDIPTHDHIYTSVHSHSPHNLPAPIPSHYHTYTYICRTPLAPILSHDHTYTYICHTPPAPLISHEINSFALPEHIPASALLTTSFRPLTLSQFLALLPVATSTPQNSTLLRSTTTAATTVTTAATTATTAARTTSARGTTARTTTTTTTTTRTTTTTIAAATTATTTATATTATTTATATTAATTRAAGTTATTEPPDVHPPVQPRRLPVALRPVSHSFKRSNIGKMSIICPFFDALLWPSEPKGLCCRSGKTKLVPLSDPPSPLDELLRDDSEESKHFLSRTRLYNSIFQMTSIGCKEVRPPSGWAPNFRIQGQRSHFIGSLAPVPGQQPKFAQIYFTGDEIAQADARRRIFTGLHDSIIGSLQRMLLQHHSYVPSLKFASELLQTHPDSLKESSFTLTESLRTSMKEDSTLPLATKLPFSPLTRTLDTATSFYDTVTPTNL